MKKDYQAPKFKVRFPRTRHSLLSGSIETGPSTEGHDGEPTVKDRDDCDFGTYW